jgi:DNA-binding NarL/FixJ family response regulator
VAATSQLRPDVVIADVSMPLLNGIEAARQIRRNQPRVKIVFFTMHSDVVYASEALRAGGSAYVLKSSPGAEIIIAIREALANRTYVTPALDRESLQLPVQRHRAPLHGTEGLSVRQREVLQLAARGQSNKEIAETLRISPRTVEFHRYQVRKALRLHTLAELVQYAIKHGLVVL